jgi:hypothetical protein
LNGVKEGSIPSQLTIQSRALCLTKQLYYDKRNEGVYHSCGVANYICTTIAYNDYYRRSEGFKIDPQYSGQNIDIFYKLNTRRTFKTITHGTKYEEYGAQDKEAT